MVDTKTARHILKLVVLEKVHSNYENKRCAGSAYLRIGDVQRHHNHHSI